MPPGKPFFARLGSQQQRVGADQQQQKQDPSSDQHPTAANRGYFTKHEHEYDVYKATAARKDQDGGLQEAKKPSVFKKLFQKCGCGASYLGHTLRPDAALPAAGKP